jgi:AcrR family transcriptional regulator
MTDRSVIAVAISMVTNRTFAAKQKRRRRPPRLSRAARTDIGRSARNASRREAILTAALDEFSMRGFEATRIDDVAKRAGVAKGTIYLYFRDKESLFQELTRAMLSPLIGAIAALGEVDMPMHAFAERFVDLFVREVYETRRRDVIRLIISEGRRFPKLAEFYYRNVLSHMIKTVRALLRRALDRGELADDALIRFPQLLVAPGIIAIFWSGLFDRFEPLDARAMMRANFDRLFAARRPT